MDRKKLSERDICTKFVTPTLKNAGLDINKQECKEFIFIDGKIEKFVTPILPLNHTRI